MPGITIRPQQNKAWMAQIAQHGKGFVREPIYPYDKMEVALRQQEDIVRKLNQLKIEFTEAMRDKLHRTIDIMRFDDTDVPNKGAGAAVAVVHIGGKDDSRVLSALCARNNVSITMVVASSEMTDEEIAKHVAKGLYGNQGVVILRHITPPEPDA